MKQDFMNMAELLGYTETRVILGIERYAQHLLSMGDVFPPDRHGVYDRYNGDCLLDFGRGGGYWTDKRGRRTEITTIDDFERARGDIYDFNNRQVVRFKHLNSLRLDAERPLIFKAKEAAISIVAAFIKENHPYTLIGKNIPTIEETLYISDIMESTRRRDVYHQIERLIDDDLSDILRDYEWNDIWISKSGSVYMLDVKIDIRIKEWYENRFREQDLEEERIRENGREYGNIRCT